MPQLQLRATARAVSQPKHGLIKHINYVSSDFDSQSILVACRSDSAKAAAQGRGKGCWVIEPCTVSQSGQTSNCGGQLQALDLEEEEWEQFAEGIAELAAKRERKPKDFEAFKV